MAAKVGANRSPPKTPAISKSPKSSFSPKRSARRGALRKSIAERRQRPGGDGLLRKLAQGGRGSLRTRIAERKALRGPGGLFGRRRHNENQNNNGVNNNNNKVEQEKKASYNVPKKLPDQLKSWRQSTEGNCSSVACIKAAVDRFDDKVFSEVKKTEDGKGYDIKMRDGYKLKLSQKELDLATKNSRFVKIGGDNGLTGEAKQSGLNFANFAYAAMAKRATNEKFGGVRSFQGALNDFQNGYYPRNSAKMIGLKNYVQDVKTSNLDNKDSVTAWNGRHAIFIDRGKNGTHLEDNWGKATRYDRRAAGKAITGAFTFKADPPPPVPAPRS